MAEPSLPPGTSVALPPGASVVTPGEKDIGVLKFVDNLARSIASGATLGFADEFAAFMNSRLGDTSLDKALTEERAKDAEFERQFPGTALTGKVVGGIASPLAKVGAPAKGAGLISTGLRGAATGAGFGALTGAGEAEGGIADRAAGALGGGIVGGVAGGILGPVMQIAGIGVQHLSRFITGKIGPESEAGRKILSALRDDKISAADAVKRLRELGPEAGLADIGEENVKGVARAAASTPGPARTQAKEFLGDRQLGQGGRIVEKAQSAFGDFRKFATTADDLMEARAAAAAPKYAEAYKAEVPLTDALLDVLQTDAGKRAFAAAKRIASNEGRKLPDVLSFTDGGTPKINVEGVPDMRAWDIIKRAFDTTLNQHRNPVTGRLDLSDPLARSVNDVRSRMVAELDRLNPAYKEARAVFAGPAQAQDAMERGRSFLKGTADETAKAIKAMTPAEQDFFRLGVIRGIQDVVENTRDVTDVTGRLFGSQAMRDKLVAVFPDAKAFKQFEQYMKAEAAMAETRKVVLGGSPTARIQAEQRRLGSIIEGVGDAATGNFGAVLRNVLASTRNEIPPEVSERLGKMLFTKGGKVNEANLRKIFRSEPLAGIPEDALRVLRGRLTAAAGVVGGQR